ncbi:hypothetical protein COLO4_00410 [Corchorus olitorius]|uniref:Uncharacterized protein n=1 Tax=Corchorus olitorius TaxID=93759 RepID=A0A1R3L3U8_9ROSI|nr:hypothetical protein COLO4_00410 [Corchorus olitorius]
MQNGSRSILDQRFLYEKYESEFEEGVLDPQEDLFNHIVWAPRIWRPWGFLFDCIERTNELGFPYWAGSFRGKRIIYDEKDELQENDEKDELQENDEKDELQENDEKDELQRIIYDEKDELQENDEKDELQENDEKDELQENDSEFLQSGTMQYQARYGSSKEQGFFRISQFIWDPPDPFFFLFNDQSFVSVFLLPRILCR